MKSRGRNQERVVQIAVIATTSRAILGRFTQNCPIRSDFLRLYVPDPAGNSEKVNCTQIKMCARIEPNREFREFAELP